MSLGKAFSELKENGFNLTYAYLQEYQYQAYIDAARESGMKLFTKTRPPDKQMVEVGRFAPEILAWYVGDDTCDFFTPEGLMENTATLKRIDPYRLTTQADSVGNLDLVDHSTYSDFVKATDVFMPEIYPMFTQDGLDRLNLGKREAEADHDARCVATVVRSLRQIKADVREFGDGSPRACWPILQCFSGWGVWKYPTVQQLRAMAYAALIHGANGLLWYTYAGFKDPKNKGVVDDPEMWSALKALAREVSGYADVLVQSNGANPPAMILSGPLVDAYGNPSVTGLLKRKGDEVCLFALNATSEEVRARFVLKKTDRNVIEETYRPFEVKVINVHVVSK